MPVPGTITPEPEPVDEESDAALPSSSTAETCVVPPAGACSARPGSEASIRGTAAASDVLRQKLLREPAAVEPRRERLGACARLLAHHLGERRDRLGEPGSPLRTRSSSASPYAIRIPPEDGGGFEITSCPR